MRKILNLKILFSLLILLIMVPIGAALYYVITIKSSNLDQIISIKNDLHIRKGEVSQRHSTLEAGSIVEFLSLKTYYLFGQESLPFEDWMNNLIENKIIERKGTDVYILEELELPALVTNSCESVYCLQHRMDFGSIPPVIWKGLIGIEDYRFLEHQGIDIRSIIRAIIIDIKEMKLVQGGSTLTQQLVKNLFLTNEKSFKRKLTEVFYSIHIENEFTKDEIINAYLNEVFWGALQGVRIKGFFSASVFYFFKKPEELDPYEASILIAMLKGPYYYHPISQTSRLRARSNTVYEKLKDLNLRPTNENFLWEDNKWQSWVENLKRRNEDKGLYSLWKSMQFTGGSLSNFEKFYFNKVVTKVLENLKGEKEKDFALKAIWGDPLCEDCKNFKFYSKVERNSSRAITDERHQIGSILKPIVYSLFVNHGKSLNDTVRTEPYVMKLKSGKWSPREPGKKLDPEVTLKMALLKSLNGPVVRIADEIGFEVLAEELSVYVNNLQKPLAEYPAQLIGALEMSISEVFTAYTHFVRTQCGKFKNLEDEQENFSVLHTLSDPRQTTVKRVVNKTLASTTFFGKTGTTNEGNDNWFVSFDGQSLGVIWFGNEGKRSDEDLKIYGSTTAFKVFQEFAMRRGRRLPELYCP